ncbi:MAG: fibronectin type III domain-containing protein [Gemmatimonadota bacterium]|nr:fibronectin type III domain-containing protein [Gemmatimonadota bacterium]
MSSRSIAVSGFGRGAWRAVRPGLWLALVAGCTQTTVVPVTVDEISVIPDRLETMVDDQAALSIELRDGEGNVLPDRPVRWASLDPLVATVDDAGVVTAVGPGQALVTATADGAVGTAQITVERRPMVRVQPSEAHLEAVSGQGGSVRETLAVDNGGGGALGTLSTAVEYLSGSGGWLSASLAQESAPTQLTVSARGSDLSAGTYQGEVTVTDGASSAVVAVSLVVTEPPPEIDLSRSSLAFAALSGSSLPPSQSVAVTNGGGQSLTGLGTQIAYSGPSGWLTATVSPGSAPATVTVRPSSTELPAGSHQATVSVTSPVAQTRTISVQFDVADPTPPQAPTGLQARARGNNRIDLDWDDESDTETRFEVERRQLGVDWAVIATLPRNEEYYRDEGLQRATWYQYRVRACNAGGCSAPSNWDSAWTNF